MSACHHFNRYLGELGAIYKDVLSKCQHSYGSDFIDEKGKKNFSCEIKSNFKELISEAQYSSQIKNLNNAFPNFQYLTDTFLNDELNFLPSNQMLFTLRSFKFVAVQGVINGDSSPDKKNINVKLYLLSYFSRHVRFNEAKEILNLLDKETPFYLLQKDHVFYGDLAETAFSIYLRFLPLKKKALKFFLIYSDAMKSVTSTRADNWNQSVLNQWEKGNISLKEACFFLEKINSSRTNLDTLPNLRNLLIKKSLFHTINKEKSLERYSIFKIFHNTRYLNETEFFAAIWNMPSEKIKDYDFSLAQRILPRLLVSLSKEKNNPIKFSQAVDIVRKASSFENEIWAQNKHWLSDAALSLSELFGPAFDGYLNKTKPFLNLHDSVFFLTGIDYGNPKNKQLGVFLKNNVIYQDKNNVYHVRNPNDLSAIVRGWHNLNGQGTEGFFRILNLSISNQYENIKDENFAKEAAYWNLPSQEYSSAENIYLISQLVPSPFDTSKTWQSGDFVGRFLDRKDVRVGFFGNYTNCCQHFVGAGKLAAISSVKDDFAGLFVIEKEKCIVAGSFVWEVTENQKNKGLCFDSVEILKAYKERDEISNIYQQAISDLKKQYHRITFGANPFHLSPAEEILPIPLNIYSDAKVQYIWNEKQYN